MTKSTFGNKLVGRGYSLFAVAVVVGSSNANLLAEHAAGGVEMRDCQLGTALGLLAHQPLGPV